MKRKGPAKGLIEDRRTPAPKMAFLALLQKLILNPPWMGEDTRDPRVPRAKMAFQTEGKLSPEDWAALSAAYQRHVKGMRVPVRPQRRSGV